MTVPDTVTGPEPAVWPLSGSAGQPGTLDAPAVVGVADLRVTNAAAVLAVVRTADPHPRLSEIVTATSLSRPTVETIAEELVDSGLIEVVPAVPTRGRRSPGRPARRFRFRPHAGYVVGVDVRPRSVTACLADLDGTPVAVRRTTVRADVSGAARAEAVTASALGAMTDAGVDAARVWAATVGTPGLVDRHNTRVRQADNLRSWARTDIVGIVRDALGCPVAVENDANLACLGERWRGVGAGGTHSDMIFVLLGERLGAGVIAGGRLLRGHHGAAGEIGFIRFPEENGSGREGMSGAGAAAPGRRPGLEPLPATAMSGAAAGDQAAVAEVEAYGRRLAEGVAPVLLALNPALVVLGTGRFPSGATAPAAELLLAAAREHAGALLVDPPHWKLSTLANDAVLTGAVHFALSSVEVVLRTRPTSLPAQGV
ncbi:ROK family protein [Streptomyces sp. NPDC013178]|uniref:ROK family transcriptional regulator n=1 Tax=Streptomyces sp. NPDC013178 TaxID=3155118 RepID=UPI0033C1CF17